MTNLLHSIIEPCHLRILLLLRSFVLLCVWFELRKLLEEGRVKIPPFDRNLFEGNFEKDSPKTICYIGISTAYELFLRTHGYSRRDVKLISNINMLSGTRDAVVVKGFGYRDIIHWETFQFIRDRNMVVDEDYFEKPI